MQWQIVCKIIKNLSKTRFLIKLYNPFSGICLIIVLLGYGLVSIPRNLWRNGNQELTLKYYQFQAVMVDETKASAEYELSETIKKAYALSTREFKNPQYSPCIKTIMKLVIFFLSSEN